MAYHVQVAEVFNKKREQRRGHKGIEVSSSAIGGIKTSSLSCWKLLRHFLKANGLGIT